jgi:hypothetical protein
MTRLALLAALLIMAALAACSDDPAEPEDDGFAITVTVRQPDGAPLAGAPVLIVPALPEWIWPWGAVAAATMPAAVSIGFEVPEQCTTTMVIRDVAGAEVRVLMEDYPTPMGAHRVLWDGRDFGMIHRPTGWYEVELTCRVDGVETFHDTASMLLYIVDYDLTPYVTGDDGTVTITDRRTVPGLWDLDPMVFVDESGDPLGMWTLTPETWIRVGGSRATLTAVDGPQDVTVTVSTAPAATASGVIAAPIATVGARDGIDPQYRLIQPYPNPFN